LFEQNAGMFEQNENMFEQNVRMFEQNVNLFEQNARMFEQKKWPGVKKEGGGTFFGETQAKSKNTLTAKRGVKGRREVPVRTRRSPTTENRFQNDDRAQEEDPDHEERTRSHKPRERRRIERL